jgi:hypothetical protein
MQHGAVAGMHCLIEQGTKATLEWSAGCGATPVAAAALNYPTPHYRATIVAICNSQDIFSPQGENCSLDDVND